MNTKIGTRFQSLLLALICICTWCAAIIPAAAVSAAGDGTMDSEAGYSQDFDGVSTDLSELESEGWKKLKTEQAAVEEDAANNHGKVVSVPNSAYVPYLELKDKEGNDLTGRYEIKLAVKPGPGSAERNYVCFTTGSGSDDINTLILAKNGSIYLSTGAATSDWLYAGTYEQDSWYIVTAIVDTSLKYYSVKINKENEDGGEGELVASKGGLPFMTQPNEGKLQKLMFRADGGTDSPMLFDNVSIKPTNEAVGNVIINDNFDSYDEAENYLTSSDKTKTPYYHGWAARVSKTAGIAAGDNGNKYLKISRESSSSINEAAILFDDTKSTPANRSVYYSGKVRLTFDWRAVEDHGSCVVFVPEGRPYTSGDGFPAIDMYNGGFYAQYKGSSQPIANKFGTYVAGQWYNFVITIDLDTQKYDVDVYYNDQLIARLKDWDTACTANNLGYNLGSAGHGLRAIDFVSNNNGNIAYIDNVKLEYLDNEEEWTGVITKPDFSQMAEGNANNYGWYLSNNGAKADGNVIIDPQDNTMTLGNASAKRTTSYFTNIGKGKINVKMSLKWNDVSSGWGMIGLTNGSGPGVNNDIVLLAYNGADLYLRNAAGNDNGNLHTASKVESEKWYDLEWVLDLDKSTISYSVKEQDSGKVILPHKNDAGKIDDKFYSNGVQKTMEDIKAIEGIRMVASGKGAVIKDFSVTEPIFTLTRDDITLKTDDKVYHIGDSDIPANITSIVLNFSSDLDASTVGGITLTKDEEPVEFTGSVVDGCKYEMTGLPQLEGGAEYKITVPVTVASTSGQTLGKSIVAQFTPAKSADSIQMVGVKQDGTAVTKISDLTPDVGLTVDTVISGSDFTSLTYISAYYSDNNVIDVEIAEPAAVTGSGIEPSVLNVPSREILDKADKVVFFLWDGTDTIVPAAEPLSMTK